MGLDVYITNNDKYNETKSAKHPEHIWNMGYFRSSYNGSGIEWVFPQLGLPAPLSYVFKPEQANSKPKWDECLARAWEVLGAYEQLVKDDKMFIAIDDIRLGARPNAVAIDSGAAAMRAFHRELDQHESRSKMFSEYSNSQGSFYMDGLQIYGAIGGMDVLKQPCVYLITKMTPKNVDWYRQALEILVEALEAVVSTPGDYSLVWSG